jgi:hypothetical protein
MRAVRCFCPSQNRVNAGRFWETGDGSITRSGGLRVLSSCAFLQGTEKSRGVRDRGRVFLRFAARGICHQTLDAGQTGFVEIDRFCQSRLGLGLLRRRAGKSATEDPLATLVRCFAFTTGLKLGEDVLHALDAG